jgi:hypothetical protein
MVTVTEKIERWKATAEIFLKNNIKVFIKDIENNFYFGDILFVGDDLIEIECFSPAHRRGQKCYLYWTLIEELDKYREEA